MDRILKVFVKGAERQALAEKHTVLEEYDAFVLLQASAAAATKLGKQHLVEDITDQFKIPLESKTLATAPRTTRTGIAKARAPRGAKAPSKAAHHYLVQFNGPVKDAWLKGVGQLGGEVREPWEGYTFVVRATAADLERIRALPFVRWVGHLPHRERLAGNVRAVRGAVDSLPRTRIVSDAYAVEFFGTTEARKAKPKIRALGFKITASPLDAQLLVVRHEGTVTERRAALNELSAIHGVRIIRQRAANRTSNNVATRVMGVDRTISNPGLGLDGAGEVVAVCDTGLDTGNTAMIHPDFAGRVALLKSYPIAPEWSTYLKNPGADDGPADIRDGHGTHVAGSAVGDGSALNGAAGVSPIRGLAVKSKLVFQAVEQETKWKSAADQREFGRYGLWGIPTDITQLFDDAYRKKARVHSNSWGGGDPGVYDDQCRQLDKYVWEHKEFCVLVAAGNDGTDFDGNGAINPMSVTSPATAKNCVTVGASENLRPEFNDEKYGGWWPDDYPKAPLKNDPMANRIDQVAAFSSRGPTEDGRIKPDVVAPGTFILSTRSTQIATNNTAWAAFPPSKLYFHMGGTSMATPLVAGAAALVRQYLRTRQDIARPSAALVKAALIAGAVRIKSGTPAHDVWDNHQGYGRVNLDAILAPQAPAAATFLQAPGLKTGRSRSVELQVTSKAVPLRIVMAYSDFPGDVLVNNLNLMVTDPDGKTYAGNHQGSSPMSLDGKNNVEVVHIAEPKKGTWQVEVVGSNVPEGPQDYALVVLGAV